VNWALIFKNIFEKTAKMVDSANGTCIILLVFEGKDQGLKRKK
jgi:hypothetical protein